MPSFAASLSPEQIAAAAAFERVRFGGADPDTTLVDCGLVEETAAGEGAPPGETPEEGGDGAEETGESGTEGGGESTTSTTP